MITLQHIYEARERIKNITHVTPILQSEQLSNRCGNHLFLKAEHIQKTGSFKIRGASNKVIHAVENGEQYITTASSGNHGQAVAYRSEEHTSELQSRFDLVCRLLLEKKKGYRTLI